MAVSWFWSGAVTTTGATVVTKLSTGATSCRLAVSTDAGFTSPTYGSAAAPDANNYVKLTTPTLIANTPYWYRVEIDGSIDTAITGTLKTLPSSGDFVVCVGFCSANSSNHRVFDAIRTRAPLLLLFLGDFHYGDISSNNQASFRTSMEGQFAQSRRAQCHREIPTAYVWDDHDFGGDNSDGTVASRPAAAAVFRQTVPHYPLANSGDNPIYQAFTIGGVRFILLDSRWGRSPNSDTDNSSKTLLGATQKTWFKAELDAYQANASLKLLVIGNPQVWIADSSVTDSWGKYTTERAELANYIRTNVTKPIFMISADQHAATGDDGSNADYSSGGHPSMPVWTPGALDPPTLIAKGGPYTRGTPSQAGGRYGVLTVEQSTYRIGISLKTISVDPTTGAETELYHQIFRWPQIYPRRAG